MDLTQRQLHSELQGFAWNILKNEEDAKDVVQDVLTRCLEKPQEQLSKAYVFRAVRNTSFNKLRSQSRLTRAKEAFLHYLDLLTASDSEHSVDIMSSLHALPQKQREVLILRIRGELSHQEIAEVMDIPVGTVKSRINKGLSKLRQIYKEKSYDR